MTIIKIDRPVKISVIKKAFNDKFPFLKIEFFKKAHQFLQGSPKKSTISIDFTIYPDKENESIIVFNDNMPVAEFEKQFNDKFKLSAQVFRKSGKTWLETTYTDSWTLKKQNDEGLELSQL